MWTVRAPAPTCGEVPGTTVHPKSQLRAHWMGVLKNTWKFITHLLRVRLHARMSESARTQTHAHITYTQKYTTSVNDHSNSLLWDVGCFGDGSQDRQR